MKIIITDLNQPQTKSNDRQFYKWIARKDKVHASGGMPNFNEGEIWWAAWGENVGVEINGKGKKFSRPVLVLKKFNKHSFMGVPLTTQPHDGTWYYQFNFNDIEEYAVFIQARTISTHRLYGLIGQIPDSELRLIRHRFCRVFK